MFAKPASVSPLARKLVYGTVRRRYGIAAVGSLRPHRPEEAAGLCPLHQLAPLQPQKRPPLQQIMRFQQQRRSLSSHPPEEVQLVLDMDDLQNSILQAAPAMAEGLSTQGYYCTDANFLPHDTIVTMRQQAISLRSMGRYEQSWSERIVDGKAVRFDKDGVHACEPDGQDYYTAPDLVTYMAVLLQTLPQALNGQPATSEVDLSASSFNAKLAVTSPGGSKYPLHIDNPQGLAAGDIRKLTCILYLNPDYRDEDGGELRILLDGNDDDKMEGDDNCDNNNAMKIVDLAPLGGRLLLFWSDEIPHEVLPTAPNGSPDDASLDRYALTVWIPTDSAATEIHSARSKFGHLKDIAFP